jgi:glucosamine--fructose-6-phosphate aminotransferase (isomerizing)
MCGIIGYIGQRQVVPLIIEGLRKLEYRGYDSAGIAVVNNGELEIRRSVGKLGNLETALAADPLSGEYGWATRAGPPTAAPPKRTRIRTATARAASSSCTTASSRTTSS